MLLLVHDYEVYVQLSSNNFESFFGFSYCQIFEVHVLKLNMDFNLRWSVDDMVIWYFWWYMSKELDFTDIEELSCMGRARSRPLGSSSAVSIAVTLYDSILFAAIDWPVDDAA